MRHEFEEAGTPVNMVAINAASAVEQQPELVKRCSFPLLQDTAEVGAWDLHAGGKDDFYVYDASGGLVAYLPVGGEVNTNLSTPEGYAAVKAVIEGVLGP